MGIVVYIMNEEEEEIPQLRAIYDELWHDAKTLIRDMSDSISMYKFSGILLILLSMMTIPTVMDNTLEILTGSIDLLNYLTLFFGVFTMGFFILIGWRLLRWYYRLKERYAKLLQMEKEIED